MQLNTGAVRSLLIICCTQVAVLPQASVAVHVRVITVWQPTLVDTSLNVGVTLPQLSVAVEAPRLATSVDALHSITASAAQDVNAGGVLSFTVIVCEQVAVLPQASVALYVLVIVDR